MASHLGLRSLTMSHLWDARLKWVKYVFANGNMRRFLVVAYGHNTKRVVDVKNDVYSPENPLSRKE